MTTDPRFEEPGSDAPSLTDLWQLVRRQGEQLQSQEVELAELRARSSVPAPASEVDRKPRRRISRAGLLKAAAVGAAGLAGTEALRPHSAFAESEPLASEISLDLIVMGNAATFSGTSVATGIATPPSPATHFVHGADIEGIIVGVLGRGGTGPTSFIGGPQGGDGVRGYAGASGYNLGAGVHGIGYDNPNPSGPFSTPGTGVLGESGPGTGVLGRAANSTGTSTGTGVHGQSDSGYGVLGFSSTGEAVRGESRPSTAGGGVIHGVLNSTSPVGGTSAVRAENQSTSVIGFGVHATHAGSGAAVFAECDAGTGAYGTSKTGTGLYGTTTNGSANASAIHGVLNNTAAGAFSAAVLGENLGTGATGIGVSGSQAGSGFGVYGTAPTGVGVRGYSPGAGTGVSGSSGGGTGVYGSTASTAAGMKGVHGLVSSTTPGAYAAGVRGENLGTAASGIGVYGSQSGSGFGVYGTAVSGTGVYGLSNYGTGVTGVGGDAAQPGSGYGGVFGINSGGLAQLNLTPLNGAVGGPPTTGTHAIGEMYMDPIGSLYVYTSVGWQKVAYTLAATDARVAHFTARHTETGTRFAWRMADGKGVAGFDLYAGGTRLTRDTIPVHAARSYRYASTYRGQGPFRLHVIFHNGSAADAHIG